MYSAWVALVAAGTKGVVDLQLHFSDFRRCFDTWSFFTSCTIPLLTFVRDPFYGCHIIQELEIHEFRVLNHFLTLRSHFIAHNFWVISHQNPAKSQLPVCPNESRDSDIYSSIPAIKVLIPLPALTSVKACSACSNLTVPVISFLTSTLPLETRPTASL